MEILQKIKKSGLLFDGAMGTMLIEKGLDSDKVSEHCNLHQQEIVKEVHQAYLNAGAEILTTNTFGGSRLKLAKAGLADKTEEININAAKIAREIAKDNILVAGDIGPSGYMLQPLGVKEPEEISDNYAEQAEALINGGADVILIETMFDLNEILAALKGVKSVTDVPVFTTMTFEKKPQGFVTVMGNQVEESLKKLLDLGADIVGANCSIGSQEMVELAKEIRRVIDTPIMVQPNAGMPETEGDQIIYPEDADVFSDNMASIKNFGVEVIGGCCGTAPQYIEKIKNKI
ncbi:MAG: homocysteine S-methyltransferase family protein [Candidatus Marinimicrobia bacterium]|nr:homocysteine S-methyltransferase family protein [Candidatus Neomarinimicrobiota bacterium]